MSNNIKLLREEQFKWTSKLIKFDFQNRYRTWSENTVVDTLSIRVYLGNISSLQPREWEDWETEMEKDTKLSAIIHDLLLVDANTHAHYELKNRLLYYYGKFVLPHESPL
ncbi:hypothetical protein V8G54_000378 [Vigna mungo]|uniref:Uncharacterized protein n=1 Tax=Vigna mungo TaxID=3915 RepID=A0AAQ3S781_VIGMU